MSAGKQLKQAGVMGWPIEHSLSPRLHSYWLKQYKIDGTYAPLAVPPDKLAEALKTLPEQGFCGVNLTIPHKETALQFIDRVDPLAKCIGAVNTVIVHDNGTLEGRNTDAYGFTQNLRSTGVKADDRPVTLLGAGGAARAAIVALRAMGFNEIRVVNRTREKAELLTKDFGDGIKIFGWNDKQALKDIALLINASPLGLKGQLPLEMSLDALPQDAVVTDMVYVPLMTDLLKRAAMRGNKIVDGLGMLLHQARPAFKAFFGADPEVTDDLRKYVLGKD